MHRHRPFGEACLTMSTCGLKCMAWNMNAVVLPVYMYTYIYIYTHIQVMTPADSLAVVQNQTSI